MDREQDTVPSISEQASHWWALLHGDSVSPADRRAFGEWVARSPERVEAWLKTAQLMSALKSRGTQWPQTPADVLIREARAAAPGTLSFSSAHAARDARANTAVDPAAQQAARSPVRAWTVALAASAAAVAVGAWLFLAGPQRFDTALGEQRSVVLADGSLVTLNTNSSMEVKVDAQRRLIRLVRGEALFNVARDPGRPFEVLAGGTTLRALGTQFNVDYRAKSTVVTVMEGRVAVLPPQPLPNAAPPPVLAATEQVVITESGLGKREHVTNLAATTAWTQRQLVFEHRPLGEVAAEFNRYNADAVLIDDPQLRGQQITGVFQANDPASFMIFLSNIPGVRIHRTDDGDHRVTAAQH